MTNPTPAQLEALRSFKRPFVYEYNAHTGNVNIIDAKGIHLLHFSGPYLPDELNNLGSLICDLLNDVEVEG